MRDLLAHHYEGTDYDAVWDTLVIDLPRVRTQILSKFEAELDGLHG